MKILIHFTIAIWLLPVFNVHAQNVKVFINDSTIYAVGEMVNNQQQGKWMYYNSATDSVIYEGEFDDGLKIGIWISYHLNGKIQSKQTYHEGLLHGEYKTYYENGVLESAGPFIGGLKEGDWIFYHDNGQIYYRLRFENDLK